MHLARAAGLSLVALLMAAAAFGGIASAHPGGSADAARDRADAARAEEAALAGDIAAQSERIDAVERQIGGLRAEVAVLEAQLGRSRARLRALEVELAQKTRELARARRQLGIAQRDLNRRLVDIYTSGEPDAVTAIVAAESLEELLDNLETRSRIAEYDDDLVQQITATRTRVRKERSRTAVLRKAQAAETARLAATTSAPRAVLSGLVAQRDALARLRAARQRDQCDHLRHGCGGLRPRVSRLETLGSRDRWHVEKADSGHRALRLVPRATRGIEFAYRCSRAAGQGDRVAALSKRRREIALSD